MSTTSRKTQRDETPTNPRATKMANSDDMDLLYEEIGDTPDPLDLLLSIEFPNTAWRVVDMNLMKTAFGDRMQGMEMPPDLEKMNPLDIPPGRYKEVPQSHPAWLALRKKPRGTGSTIAKYAGLHDIKAAKYLKLPPTMHVTTEYNEDWDLFALREKHGYLPNKSFDQPGAVFAKWGKWHEDNCLAAFLASNVGWTHQECGLTVITDDMLEKRGIYDVFNGDNPIGPFPIQLADSPDGVAYGPDRDTGEIVRRGCEFKTGTPFIPKSKASYPLAEFFMRAVDSVKPYPAVKPYYVQQCFFHMLALEVDECYFVSWTYGGGMRTWLIRFSLEYVSLLLSIIKFIYLEFVCKGKRVPTDYFMDTKDKTLRAAYMRLLDMTNNIVSTNTEYAFVPGDQTRAITNRLSVCTSSAYQKFPNVPDEYPLFMRNFFYLRVLCCGTPVLTWVQKYEEIETRLNNLKELRSIAGFEYLSPVLIDITQGKGYTKEQMKIDVVKDEMIIQCESYVFDILKYIYHLTHHKSSCYPLAIYKVNIVVFNEVLRMRKALIANLSEFVESQGGAVKDALDCMANPTDSPDWWNAMHLLANVIVDVVRASPHPLPNEIEKYTDLTCLSASILVANSCFVKKPLPVYILAVCFHMNILLRFLQLTRKQ